MSVTLLLVVTLELTLMTSLLMVEEAAVEI
jgi:hypothetical protein